MSIDGARTSLERRAASTVREVVGPDVDVLVEMHRRLAPMHAIRIAAARGVRAFWYEEPVLTENLDALADVKQGVSIPVVTGEELYTGSCSGMSSRSGPQTSSIRMCATLTGSWS